MAHRTKQDKPCAHTKQKTQAHGQQNKSPAMCRTGHKHAANEDTHKPRVHTKHDNMKARSQCKTQAVCHTAPDITWMHSADKTWTACNNTRQVDRRGHAPTTRENMERETRHETETQDMSAGIRTPRSNTKQGTQTRERTARAHSKPRTHMKTGQEGSIRVLSQNHK